MLATDGRREGDEMRAILGWGGAMLVGGLGWWLGARVGLWAAVVLSAIGTGAGLYWGRRWHDDNLG